MYNNNILYENINNRTISTLDGLNLVLNPGFETGVAAPDSWVIHPSGGIFTWETACTRTGGTGTRCVSIDIATNQIASNYWSTLFSSVIPVDATKLYHVYGYMKTVGVVGGGSRIQIAWFNTANPNGFRWDNIISAKIGTDIDFVKYELPSIPVPVDALGSPATSAGFNLVVLANTTGKTYWDDMYFADTTGCIPPNPNFSVS